MAVAEISLHLDMSEAAALRDFLSDVDVDETDDYDIITDIHNALSDMLDAR